MSLIPQEVRAMLERSSQDMDHMCKTMDTMLKVLIEIRAELRKANK